MTDPATPNVLEKVEYVIVLMLENRSFDHLLGYLTQAGRTDIAGLTGTETNPYQGKSYRVFAIDEPANGELTPFPLKSAFWPDPIHAHCPTWTQLLNRDMCTQTRHSASDCPVDENYEINMDGFVRSYLTCDAKERDNRPQPIMGHYTQRTLPVFQFLADNFCVVNGWFSSNVGSTVPNRLFSLAGTTLGMVDNTQVAAAVKADEIGSRFEHALQARTIFDALSDKGVSWRAYYHNLCMLWMFNDYLTSSNVQPVANLWRILDGSSDEPLPAVSWIDPDYTLEFDTGHPLDTLFGDDDHSPTDIRLGQLLVQSVYERLAASAYWDKTLLIITYDEHGGYYDHLPPPAASEKPPFQNYGVRVPTFLVSPWIEKRSVVSLDYTFDHTSLIRSLLDRFCQGERLDGTRPNRSDTATSLNVVPALEKVRQDCPATIDGPDIDALERDLQALTAELEAFLSDRIRAGISDWQQILHVLSQLRRIIEEDVSAVRKIANWIRDKLGAIWRWILKPPGIRPTAAEAAFKPWRQEQLEAHLKRRMADLRERDTGR